MALQMQRIQVWTGEIPDEPGAAAVKLEMLARAGTDLEFIFTRPHRDKPNCSSIFLAPITTPLQIEAAHQAGLEPARDIAMLRLEGDNRRGVGYDIMSRLAVAGLNLRGISISSLGSRFSAYLAFDHADAVAMAIQVLAGLED